jgi:predicted ATPase
VEAVHLLRSRAEAARPGVAVADDTAVAIVAAVSGLPLAIELAAARLSVLSPEQLLTRLTDPARVLSARTATPDRHRSIADAIAWTRADLDPSDRADLAALAAGGIVSHAAAERLCDAGWAEDSPAGPAVLGLVAAYVGHP